MGALEDAGGLPGAEVVDPAGERVGSVNNVYVEPRTGVPQWVTVRTGPMDFEESFVPLRGARLDDDGRLVVAVAKDRVKQAPLLDTDAPLTDDDSERLDAHYAVAGGASGAAAGGASGAAAGEASGDAMTRSEERLVTGTREEPVEKVRLRKYLVTEEKQITVPVTREEVRLERVPVGEADEPAGAEPGPAPDVVLHEEQVVVRTESVPVERVRLSKETVHEEETVTRPVRKERIDYEGPEPRP